MRGRDEDLHRTGLRPLPHTQVVGGSLGLAVLSTLAAQHTDTLLASGTAPLPATAEGYRLAFRVATLIAAAALALAAAVLRTPRVRDAG